MEQYNGAIPPPLAAQLREMQFRYDSFEVAPLDRALRYVTSVGGRPRVLARLLDTYRDAVDWGLAEGIPATVGLRASLEARMERYAAVLGRPAPPANGRGKRRRSGNAAAGGGKENRGGAEAIALVLRAINRAVTHGGRDMVLRSVNNPHRSPFRTASSARTLASFLSVLRFPLTANFFFFHSRFHPSASTTRRWSASRRSRWRWRPSPRSSRT